MVVAEFLSPEEGTTRVISKCYDQWQLWRQCVKEILTRWQFSETRQGRMWTRLIGDSCDPN
jgi:hypothetical protein